MPTKLELNQQYYQLNKEKLREKRRQRYLLNKNGKSEQSLTEQSLKNSLNTTEQLFNSEQKENVQSETSEQTEPSLNTFNQSEQNIKPCPECPKLQTKIKELELKIISLQETNQILRKDLAT